MKGIDAIQVKQIMKGIDAVKMDTRARERERESESERRARESADAHVFERVRKGGSACDSQASSRLRCRKSSPDLLRIAKC